MDKTAVKVLVVEDDLVDLMACRRAFSADPDYAFSLQVAENGQDGLDAARNAAPDCILLDYHLPDMTGLDFLGRLGAADVPVIVLTGADSASVAAEAMRRGASDYLVKDMERRYLEFLPATIERVLREQRMIDEKRQLEAKFRTLVEQVPVITYVAESGSANQLSYISPQIRVLSFSAVEWLSDPTLHEQHIHPDDRAQVMQTTRVSRLNGIALCLEYRLLARDGAVLWVRDEAQAIRDQTGKLMFMQGILVDITRNKLAEEALRESQDALRKLAAHQETIKEGERKRIAQEIHDELGGLLTGIRAHIAVAIERAEQAGQGPDPLLVDAAALAKDAIETVRKVITDLRPSVLDQLGVWAALEWYAEQSAMRSGIDCDVVIDRPCFAWCKRRSPTSRATPRLLLSR